MVYILLLKLFAIYSKTFLVINYYEIFQLIMEIDKLIEGADIVRFIKAQKNQMAGPCTKNRPRKTS